MNNIKEYTSLRVVSYAMPYFLWSLLNNGVNESDFVITKEDNDLVVRIRTNALMESNYPKANFLKNKNTEVPACDIKKIGGNEMPEDFRINDYDSNTAISITTDPNKPAPIIIM